MKIFLKKNKFWVNITVFGLFLAVIAGFVIRPLIKKIVITSDAIQEKIIDNQILQERIAKIPEIETAMQVFNDREDDMDVILAKDSEVDFIKKLEALAEETGNKIILKIEEAQPQAPKAEKGKEKSKEKSILDEMPADQYIIIHISLEGGYVELVNFVHKLENFNYYINIISLDATKQVIEEKVGGSSLLNSKKLATEEINLKKTIKSNIKIAVYLKK